MVDVEAQRRELEPARDRRGYGAERADRAAALLAPVVPAPALHLAPRRNPAGGVARDDDRVERRRILDLHRDARAPQELEARIAERRDGAELAVVVLAPAPGAVSGEATGVVGARGDGAEHVPAEHQRGTRARRGRGVIAE